ncbi:MAG: hypothetical protein V7K53_33655 [Nostoc sp.]|uniref:hypothetical protein n=1 Tax=Nostoc sp. TaxID=1180 RepID=UPI002FF594D0
MQNSPKFKWQRILLLTAAGFVAVVLLETVYHEWQNRSGLVYTFQLAWLEKIKHLY